MHLKKCHPEEGLENLNIFCRICEPDVLRYTIWAWSLKSENEKNMYYRKHIFRAVNNFDEEEELVHHMQEKHEEMLKRIKGPQQFLN